MEALQLVTTGWAHEIAPARELVRERVRVSVAGASDQALDRDPYARASRLPQEAHHVIRRALEHGPVLVQTPRSGYAPSLACERCRTPARCRECQGALRQGAAATAPPSCSRCGRSRAGVGVSRVRPPRPAGTGAGDVRTAEELGRTFAPTRVVTSSGDGVKATVDRHPALVVATPGAEPVAEGGYAGVVLLDTWLPLSRGELRAGEEAFAAVAQRGGAGAPRWGGDRGRGSRSSRGAGFGALGSGGVRRS